MMKYLVACAQCCMKCVEVIVKWINRNAYVYIAITGKAFFASAGAATGLLLRNSAKSVAVTYVGDAALLLAKLCIVGINTIGAYGVLVFRPNLFANLVFNPTLTLVLVGVATFLIATLFFGNYQLAIDTIFLSALEDLDKNDGSAAKPYYMSPTLLKIMHKSNSGSKAVAPSTSDKVNQF